MTAPAPGWDAAAALARLGNALKRARGAQGISAHHIATMIDSHQNWVFAVESGQELGLRALSRFAEALNCSTSVFVDAYLGAEERDPPPFERVGDGGAAAYGHALRHLRHRARLRLDQAEAAGAGRQTYLGTLERGAVGSPSLTVTHRVVSALTSDDADLRDRLVSVVRVYAGELPAPPRPLRGQPHHGAP